MEKKLTFVAHVADFTEHAADLAENLSYDIKDLQEKLEKEFSDIAELKAFATPDALRKHLATAKAQLLGNIKLVPKAIRMQYDAEFERAENECLPLIHNMQRALAEISKMKLTPTLQDGKVTLDPKQVESRAKDFATYSFSPLELEYAKNMEQLTADFKALKDFETANHLTHPANLEQILLAAEGTLSPFTFFKLCKND